MGNAVKIEGPKLETLFSEVIERNTILSMNVVGANFDQLTCITGIEDAAGKKHLLVDPPVGFQNIAKSVDPLHLRFNFNGPDRLEYLFSTHGGALTAKGIRIPFPDYVERLQRRLNFRIEALPSTQMFFTMKKVNGVIDLINISLGGIYGALLKHNFPFIRGSLLKKGQRIESGYIVFPDIPEIPGRTIHLGQADVIRVDPGSQKEIYNYALKFIDLEKEAEEQLKDIIYELQRRYLRFGK